MAGVDDKRQSTITLACTLSGYLLLFKFCMKAKQRCHPRAFPDGCDMRHTTNHWANSETSLRFVPNNFIPYIRETCKET